MKRIPLFVLCAGLLLSAGEARAERTSTRLTRAKLSDHLYTFRVKAERVRLGDPGEVYEFVVTVTPKDEEKHITDGRRTGHLEVQSGKELISSSAVEAKERNGVRTYTFQVAAKYARDSRFVFSETVNSEEQDLALQGFYYWFTLADFLDP